MSEDRRLTWDQYFLQMTFLVAQRSTCLRHHIGALTVRNNRVVTTGYNGAVRGSEHCLEIGCLKDELGIKSGDGHSLCRAVHAEENAILQASRSGANVEGATMYCTHTPCVLCAKAIIQAGIVRIVTCVEYPDTGGVREMFVTAGINLDILEMPSLTISYKR